MKKLSGAALTAHACRSKRDHFMIPSKKALTTNFQVLLHLHRCTPQTTASQREIARSLALSGWRTCRPLCLSMSFAGSTQVSTYILQICSQAILLRVNTTAQYPH